jgi:hypothetical protein
MENRILIQNATIINEERKYISDLLIENERISKIKPNIEDSDIDLIIDATNKILLPGLIDDQVHFREPGLTHKATINSESNTTYFVHVDKSIAFTDGSNLGKDMEWNFKTENASENDSINTNISSPNNNFPNTNNTDNISTTAKNKTSSSYINSQSSTQNTYIHSGDLLNIIVYNKKGIKELGQKTRVYLDGTLTFPYAGTIKVTGKTILQLKHELEKKLSNFYLNPTVNVWFEKKSSRLEKIKITLIGAISQKGSLKIAKNTSIDIFFS